MHFDNFQGLAVEFKREGKLFKLPEAFVQTNEAPHISGTFMALVLLQELQIVVHLIYVQSAILA